MEAMADMTRDKTIVALQPQCSAKAEHIDDRLFVAQVGEELIPGCSALHVMVAHNDAYRVRLYLEAGADVNAKTGPVPHSQAYWWGVAAIGHKKSVKTYTALHVAVMVADTQLIQVLLEFGANVNACDHNCETPLELSLWRNPSAEVAELLVNSGADYKSSRFDSFPVLFRAIERQNEGLVRLFARLQTRCVYYENQSPIEYAMNAFPECVVHLIAAGRQLHFQSPGSGETPLHMAVRHKNVNWIKKLCAKECDPNAADLSGNRCLHIAVQTQCNSQIIRLLLELGANPNAKNYYNLLPICYAIEKGDIMATDLLFEFGSSLSPQHIELKKSFCNRQFKTALILLKNYKSKSNPLLAFGSEPIIWFFVKHCVSKTPFNMEGMAETMKRLVEMSDDVNSFDRIYGSLLHYLIWAMYCVPNECYKPLFKALISYDKCNLNPVSGPVAPIQEDGVDHSPRPCTPVSFALQWLECGFFAEELIRFGADLKDIDWEHIYFSPMNVKAFKMLVLSGRQLPATFRELADPSEDVSVEAEDQEFYNREFKTFIDWLDTRQTNPLSLKQSSRIVIRKSLGVQGCRQLETNGARVFGIDFNTIHTDLCQYLLFRRDEDLQ